MSNPASFFNSNRPFKRFWLALTLASAILSGCQANQPASPTPSAADDSLGPHKNVEANWNNQYTCTENEWHPWQIPNERFPGIVARAVASNGRYEIQFGNGYYRPVRVTWNATSSTQDTQPTQSTILQSGVSTASPIVTTISTNGAPTPDLFINILDVQPAPQTNM